MRTIYLDMDGVVADFNAYARSVLKKTEVGEKWPHEEWVKLRDNPRMYRDLPKTPYADQLVETATEIVNRNKWQLLFLTAVPKNNDIFWAFSDKVTWARIRYPWVPVHFGPYSHDKHVHAKPNDILIDDRTSNITEWNAAGGIGILHRDIETTLQQLKDATQ